MRVLLVDDDKDGADTMAMLLRMLGHTTRTACDGEECLDAMDAFLPDIVLLDIGLPGQSGYEVCRCIKGRPDGRKPMMVALTGWGGDDDKRRASEAGFDRHLTKPVDVAVLQALLLAAMPRADGLAGAQVAA